MSGKIKDSGSRRQFDTGAVRDDDEDKGRCDLMPLDIIGEFIAGNGGGKTNGTNCVMYSILDDIDLYIRTGINEHLFYAIQEFIHASRFKDIGTALLELSKHFKEGAKKYPERNWEKGIPCHSFVDSGVRHLIKWGAGWDDEPHDRAFLWNMFALLWTVKHNPGMNDLPFAEINTTEVSDA